jgi:urease accessory protein
MSIDADLPLLRLLQIVSPALPTGAFAYSQGLEQAVAEKWVTDETEARMWLLGLLRWSFATLDMPVLARLMAAWRNGDALGVTRWSRWLLASRPTRELRAEDRQLGGALARVLDGLGLAEASGWGRHPDVTHATMFALAAVRFAVAPPAAVAGAAFAWAEAVTAAAVRLVPLGQTAGQRILAAAGSAIPALAARALTLPDDELGAAAPGQEVVGAPPKKLYSLLFCF